MSDGNTADLDAVVAKLDSECREYSESCKHWRQRAERAEDLVKELEKGIK